MALDNSTQNWKNKTRMMNKRPKCAWSPSITRRSPPTICLSPSLLGKIWTMVPTPPRVISSSCHQSRVQAKKKLPRAAMQTSLRLKCRCISVSCKGSTTAWAQERPWVWNSSPKSTTTTTNSDTRHCRAKFSKAPKWTSSLSTWASEREAGTTKLKRKAIVS